MDRNEAECHKQTSSCTSDGSLEDFLILQRMPPKLKNDIKNNTPMKMAVWHQMHSAESALRIFPSLSSGGRVNTTT